MEETPSTHPVAVVPTLVTEKEESVMNEEKAVNEVSKALVADILPSKEEVTLDEIGQNGNGHHVNGLNGEDDAFGGSAHAKIHEEYQEEMKQPVIEIEPETHSSEDDQEVPEPTRVVTEQEKPPSPTVDQATPDSALSEEEQQDEKIAPPTPPPSHFETPVPEGEDIQEDVARKLIEQHLQQDTLVEDPVAPHKSDEPQHPHTEEDIVESHDVPKEEPEAKLELDTTQSSEPSPGSEDIVSSDEVLTESQLPLSPTAEAVPQPGETLGVSEEQTNPSITSVKSLDLESVDQKQTDEAAKEKPKPAEEVPPIPSSVVPALEEPVVESEPVPENVPQVEAQEHAAHPATEPKLVEQEDEPVKHVLLEPDNLEEVKEPEPPHSPASHSASEHVRPAARPKTPEITVDTSATDSDAHKSPKFPVEAEAVPVVQEEKPARPPPPSTHVQEENKPSTSDHVTDHPSGDESTKEKKTGTLTRARESFANARKRCAIL